MDDDFIELGESDLIVTRDGFVDKKSGKFVSYEELEDEGTEEDSDRSL